MASTPLFGVVFVNNDLSGSVQEKLISQLFIDILLTGDEFDANVADGYTDGYYLAQVKANNQRVMVIRPFDNNGIPNNIPNRALADVILFVKNGLASVLTQEGHKPSVPVVNIYWGALGFH
jgi:hypothetical protein